MSIKKRLLSLILLVFAVLVVGQGGVYADELNTRGGIPDMGDEIIFSNLDTMEYLPSAAYNWKHHEYLVVWHTTLETGKRVISGARVSTTGELIQEFNVYADATKDSAQPDVSYDPVNDRYLVVFIFDINGNGTNWDVHGRFIPWNGPNPTVNKFSICNYTNQQWNPKVVYARSMEEYLVVWNNTDQAGVLKANISLQRVNAENGTLGADLTIYDDTYTEHRTHVDVDYNLARNEYLVVYDNTHNILATRFTGNLLTNFGGEFSIAGWPATETKPAVAACRGANQYMITWQSDQSDLGTPNDAIYARLMSGDGVLGAVKEIDDTTSPEQESDVTCNYAGDEYLVAWQTRYTNLKFGIWGRLVQPDWTLGTSFAIVHPYGDEDRTNVALAGGHITYMAVWEYERDSFQNIRGKIMVAGLKNFLPLILK
jgi:hypothetical protein